MKRWKLSSFISPFLKALSFNLMFKLWVCYQYFPCSFDTFCIKILSIVLFSIFLYPFDYWALFTCCLYLLFAHGQIMLRIRAPHLNMWLVYSKRNWSHKSLHRLVSLWHSTSNSIHPLSSFWLDSSKRILTITTISSFN